MRQVIAALAVLGLAGSAGAVTSCTLDASPLRFDAPYFWTTPQPLTKTAPVATVTCRTDAGTPARINIALDPAPPGGRRLVGPNGATLAYSIALDAGGSNVPVASSPPAPAQTFTATASIPPGQLARVGAYTGTVTVTVTIVAP